MALPAGVTTANLTVGAPVSFSGFPIRSSVQIVPSAFLVHSATGIPLVNLIEETATLESVVGQFTLPHTDQAGFQDENGNAYTNWYYTATINYSTDRGPVGKPLTKVFQLPSGQTIVDLDLLPGGAPAMAYSAPVATVTSVAGLTGAVTGSQIISAPEVQTELSATILDSATTLIERSPAASKQRITAQGAVTFSWDDGYERCHRVLLPILQNEYPNQRHTFGISSNLINSGAQFMTTAQVQDIYDAGHEIANHGYNHLNAKNATAPQRLAEFDTSQDQLEAMVGERPTTWIYPEGNNGRDAVTDMELYGRFKRIVNAGPSWGGSLVPMNQRNGMFMIARPAEWTSATHQQVLEMIRQAASQPVILNLYAHRPGDGPTGGTSGGGAANMTVAEIREALDLVEELGIPAVTIRDAFPGQPLLANPDAEKGTTGWFPVTSGAGKTFTTETVGVVPGFKGDKAFKLSSTDATGFIYVVQDIPCAEGQSFTFSARVRKTNTTTNGTATIRIQAMDQFGASMGSIYSSAMGAADGQWVKCIATHPAAPVGASVMRVSAILNTHVGDMHFKHLYYGRTGLGDFG